MMKVLGRLVFLLVLCSTLAAQQTTDFSKALHWRAIGPFRGGRVRAIAGVPAQPNVFYFAQVNGGVFKSNDYGRTWNSIWDDQPIGSVGAIAVAESDPNLIYVGSGEGLHRPDLSVGDGIYKSTDAGKTWTHLGLRDAQQIGMVAVDPKDANRVLVAAAGHPYGPNEERGVFLSTDGGQNFQKVLYKDENTGASDVVFDRSNPSIAYATLWEAREGPWENAAWNGTNGGIFKSTDGGKTWSQLSGGLPQGIVQAHIAVADSDSNRLFASVATREGVKLWRSADGGTSWQIATEDARPAGRIGGGDLSVPRFDPKNPETVYVTSTVTWKSTDGGKAWTGFRGAPGGDDYQNIWINPNDPKIILIGSDQGTIVSVNGGESWSSWYNQNTAQMYHVNADNDFPYHLCSGQQESGSACIATRGNDGEVTFREWHPVAAEEYGYVVPDPLDPNIIIGGKLTRYDRRTAQGVNIAPKAFRGGDFRVVRTEPIVFSPKDQHILYFGANTLWMTRDLGNTWQQISPDLSRKTWGIPASVGKYKSEQTAQPTQRGVIYAVAPSPFDVNRIWVGTDDGLIYRTDDGGKNWQNITPPQLAPWMKVSVLEASHFDSNTAYAAINTLRLDDLRPHILRTRDGGKTWQEIVNGIPQNENTNTVREDPVRKGLLFAGTERQVHVSFDDGEHWQSLRLNMAPSSVRDLTIHGDDLAAGTHGRGFWVLDNITPLRQQAERASATTLFKPQEAIRVRWNMNTDTPLPPDFPAGENPPDGAVIDYYLAGAQSGPVVLEIKDSKGQLVRRYSSTDPVEKIDPAKLQIPAYWVREPKGLSAAPGLHRFLWDMHYAPMPGVEGGYPIAAIPHNTAPGFTSPWVAPGDYTVTLTAGGKSQSQPLKVVMDPRVKTPAVDLAKQFTLSKQVYDAARPVAVATAESNSIREQLNAIKKQAGQTPPAFIGDFEKSLNNVAGGGGGRGAFAAGGAAPQKNLSSVRGQLLSLLNIIQEADAAPTQQVQQAVTETLPGASTVTQAWQQFVAKDIPAVNQQLKGAGLPQVDLKRRTEPEQLEGNEE